MRLEVVLSVTSLLLVIACASPPPPPTLTPLPPTATPTSTQTSTPARAESRLPSTDNPTIPVSVEVEKVRLVFQSFKEALVDSNGALAASLVDQRTVGYYAAMRLLAIHGTANDVGQLSTVDKAMVLTIRQMTAVDSLLAMDGRDVFANAVNSGWIGAGAVVQSDLGDVTVVGNTAISPVHVGEQVAPYEWLFRRENGDWKLNLASINEASNVAITQVISNAGVSEEEFLLRMVESMSGRQPSDTIFDPMTASAPAAQSAPLSSPVPQPELEDAEAYLNRGITRGEQGRLNEAIADFNEALGIDPDYAPAYFRRGEAHLRMGRPDDAIDDFSRAIELNPEDARPLTYMGGIQQVRGELEEAEASLTRAIEIDPDGSLSYYIRGIVFGEQGKLQEAIADFSTAIDLQPSYTAAYLSRGFAYGPQGNLEEAIADFDKAIEIDPSLARAYYGRGLAYSQQDDSVSAIREFRRYLEIAPNAPDRAEVEQRIRALETTT